MCVLHVPYAYAAEDAEGQIGSLRVELKNQQLKARIESSPLFGGAAQVGIILSHYHFTGGQGQGQGETSRAEA